ncbi:MAG: hypothetical protein C4567_03635 [Deltaproteobacteria bacterium]|nr:MAG: hypothetical protein C4567_03635 [Deltaproteobacteria bacterium]
MTRGHKGKWHKGFLILGILVSLLMGLTGCADKKHAPYLTDPKIKAGPPEAFIRPDYFNYHSARLAIMPFRVPAQVWDVSYPITEIFHRLLLEKRPFRSAIRVKEYADDPAEAQEIAKALGADLFLLGEVPYFLDSGTTGRSGVQVELRVVDTKTGQTIWYLSDNILAEPAPMIDLWVTETIPKPSPSIYFLVEALAKRMTAAMQTNLEAAAAQAKSGKTCPPGSGSTCATEN